MSIKIGDTVIWRHAWGSAEPKKAVIETIEILKHAHHKEGKHVDEIPIEDLKLNRCIVTLTNGSWAYGYQIEPISEEKGAQK